MYNTIHVPKAKPGYKFVEVYFKKYEEIPEDWNIKDFKEFIYFQEGPGLLKAQFGNTGIPFLNIRTFTENGIDKSKCQLVKKEEFEGRYEHFLLNENDLVISSSGSIGKVVFVKKSDLPLMLNTSTIRLTPINDEKLDRYFLRYFMETKLFKDQIRRLNTGTAILNFGPSHLNQTKFLLPRIQEQRKIGLILLNVNDAIQNTNQIIEQTKRLKKGMMQKLLTKGIEHTKFKKVKSLFGKYIEIPSEWDFNKIRNVSELFVPLRDKPKKFDGTIPWLTIADLDGKYVSRSKSNSNVKIETVKKMNLTIYPVGTVICSISASIGVCAITTSKLITNQRFIGVYPNSTIDKEFLYYFLNTQTRNILRVGTGSIHPYASKDEFGKIPIVIPPLSEQKQITYILSNVDTLIQKENLHKSYLESLKKGLTQKLLTGKIRVKF